MTKKRKTPIAKRPLTKHQLSKWQRQRRMQRIITIAGVLFLAFILAYIGYGYYSERIKPFHQPVVKVNDTVFDMDYYLKVLEIYSRGQESSTIPAWATVAVQVIEQNEIMKQGAASLGIGVSAEEIKSGLSKNNLPDDKVFRDMVGNMLLTDKLLKDYFDSKLPTVNEQVKVQAMFLESKQVAKTVMDSLVAGDNFTSLAKAYSVESMTKDKSGDLGWVPRDFAGTLLGDSLLKEIAFSLKPGMLGEPTYDESVTKSFGYWLIQVLEKDENKGSHARGILLGSRQETEEIKAKLVAGEDFATLAKKYSQHLESKDKGGDFGWLQPGVADKNKAVNRVVFALEPGVISEPIRDDTVQTHGGYWLVKVLDKDANRQIEPEIREKLNKMAFEKWFNEVKEKSSIKEYLDEAKKSWAVNQIIKQAGG